METLLNILNVASYVLVAVLIIILVKVERKNKKLKLQNNSLEKEVKELKATVKSLEFNADWSKDNELHNKKLIATLKNTLNLIINPSSSLLVYTLCNFYKNFNFYNKRYYAKVNNKPTNNKAEAIPFLQVNGKNNIVLDLYKLKYLFNITVIEEDTDLLEIINTCYINKEEVINTLGNKVLKGYRG